MTGEAEMLLDEAMAPLLPILADEATEDLAMQEYGICWVYRCGRWHREEVVLSPDAMWEIVKLAGSLTHKNVDEGAPLLDAHLPRRERFQACLAPAVLRDTISFSIRKPSSKLPLFDEAPALYHTEGWNQRQGPRGGRDMSELLALYGEGDFWAFLRAAVKARLEILFAGDTGSGKAQPLTSKVLTPTGWRAIGTLRIGDPVTCPDGSVSRVRGVFPQGKKQVFETSFSDGRAARSTLDHLWQVWDWRTRYETGKSHETRKSITGDYWTVAPLSTIRGWFDNNQVKAKRAAIPLVEAFSIELPSQQLPIPPYVLGVLLGDGHFQDTGGIMISTADDHILASVAEEMPGYETALVANYDHRIRLKTRRGLPRRGWTDTPRVEHSFPRGPDNRYEITLSKGRRNFRHQHSPLAIAIEDLGLARLRSHQKFVPPIYKMGSLEQRSELLRGLMDTDGSVSGARAEFASTSWQLAKDVQELAWSLGAIATITKRQTHYTYKGTKRPGKPSWRVGIVHPQVSDFFTLPRKVAACAPKTMRHRLRIRKIRRVEDAECLCISIDDPRGLYITDDYIVTHNTTMAKLAGTAMAPDERIITIEDAEEMDLRQPNVVKLFYASDGQGPVTVHSLQEAALRMRPDRILIQEVRQEEVAWAYVRRKGHHGSLATIHARDSASAAQNLFQLFKGSQRGRGFDDSAAIAAVSNAIDVIVPLDRDDKVSIRQTWFRADAEARGETFADLLR